MVYLTRALLDVLLETAAEREPERVTVGLAVTPAGDIEGLDTSPETPVFTHFYLPEAGRPVTAVFGVDLSTPPGRTPGLFVSHPDGHYDLTSRDDFREIVFVAVPPWDSVVAFGRDGRRREVDVLDVEPPVESPP